MHDSGALVLPSLSHHHELAIRVVGQHSWQKSEAHLQSSERQILQGNWEQASHVQGWPETHNHTYISEKVSQTSVGFDVGKVLSVRSMAVLQVLVQASPSSWSPFSIIYQITNSSFLDIHLYFITELNYSQCFVSVYLFSMSQLYTSLVYQLSPAQNPIARKRILCD